MYSVGKFAKMIGVSPDTLRNWEKKKKLIPLRTEGNQRRYTIEQYNQMMQIKEHKRISIGYCRVSAKHQKNDLERQIDLMELFIASRGEEFEIISDVGSGINYNKKGLGIFQKQSYPPKGLIVTSHLGNKLERIILFS